MTLRCIALLSGLFFAGCATATIEDAVPAGALEPQAAAAAQAAPADIGAPASAPTSAPTRAPTAGTYPNLNVAPPAAAPQITPQQKAQETAGLRAKRAQLAQETGGAAAADDAQELRRLAGTHAEQVLKEIEGE